MNKVTFIFAYYENPTMLDLHCQWFSALPDALKRELQLIVVDDGSPRWPAQFQPVGFPFEIYRMRKDVRWNQDACRNIGAKHARNPWLFLTDMDHLIPAPTVTALVEKEWDRSRAYKFSRKDYPTMAENRPHPNTWFLTHKNYWRLGGYDERFSGYYGTDAEFRDRVIIQCGEPVYVPEIVLRVPREVIPDASTTTYVRKEPFDGPTIRRIKQAREVDPAWKPLNLTFEYDRVA